jgi:hypothetical protein
MRHPLQRGILAVLASVIVLLAVGCGSGGGGGGGLFAGGGIGGTGITSGTITGFGSVFVNGIEFETGSSSFDVDDDNTASQDDLDIGMVVTVVGTVNDDGVSGNAVSIVYDDEVEGPIANNPVEDADMTTKTFTVFDITVIADKDTTVFSATDYASLSKDDIVEISGFFDGGSTLVATWIERQGKLILGSSEVEIKGTVSGFNNIDTFTLHGVTVKFDGATDLSDIPGGVITNGQYVEVKGVLNTATAIFARRIELEDEGFEDSNNAVSIEGLVTDFNGLGDFKVSGQRVNASDADFSPPSLATSMGNGDKVEVEGPVTGGVLRAAEVEQRGGSIKIGAQVTGVDVPGATLRLEVVPGEPAIIVLVDTQTQMEDDELDVEPFSLADIKVGDELVIEGFVVSGGVVATQLQRKVLDAYELQGPVDAAGGDEFAGSVTILGVTIATDDNTGFEAANEDDLSGAVFYSQVVPGDLVEFQFDVPVNGIAVADEVGFED